MNRVLRWISGHRSVTATGLSAVVIAAVVATIGITSSGYQAQRLDLSDGTVWVANDSLTAIGRANPAVLELNSAVRSTGADLSVVQNASHVLLVDRSDATVGVVDTATAALTQTVPLPPDQPDVLLAGGNAVVVSGKTGEFWSLPVSGLDGFDSSAAADLTLGAGVVTGMSPKGTMIAYSADSGEVSRVDNVSQFGVSSTDRLSMPKGDAFQVASIGSHWAVLDTKTHRLVVDGNRVDLTGKVSGRVMLQQSSDAGASVRVASAAGLLSVAFDGGSVSTSVSGRDGTPARPLVTSRCTYAAWADGAGWNDCTSSRGALMKLPSMPSAAIPVLAVNGSKVVANDEDSGRSWAVQRRGQLIDNWSDLITDQKDDRQQIESDHDKQKLEIQPKPPVAVDDALGARPGRATLLPVLLNDYDPNGDPLAITETSPLDESVGRLDVVSDRQQVLLTLAAGATGAVTFTYTITDGRGGSDTATVTVAVRNPGENSPPQQVRSTRAVVSSSGRVTIRALGDWVDPDGDPFYVTGASGGDGGTVTFKPSGDVIYQDSGKGPSTQEILVSVSDGTDTGRGTIAISVDDPGRTPLSAESFTVGAYSGRPLTIDPMPYASGGTGPLKLNSVPSRQGVTTTPSYTAGTFTFQSQNPGTFNVEYTVTDGDKTASGTVRVDVQAPPEPNTAPITTPKTVFVESLSTQTVDITASDDDPAGNVLMVTSTSALPAASGVQVQTLEQRYLRVTLTAPLERGPVTFTYTVTNGLASAQGVVTVVQIPRPAQLQPPIATNDQVTARVGEAIDIAVLDNDAQPDGEAIVLEPKLVQNVSSGGGLLFVSGTQLRYLAPKAPGNFNAEYAISGPDGQRATAQVSISVREADRATDDPPVPRTLTARVVAGQTVRIQIPLADIDPEGDSVQFLGVDSNPQKGNVATVGTNYVDYAAGSYSAGTDTFTYSVIDSLGARATGTIRVGIAARAQGSRNPIAVADAVTMRPGGSILVRVLANDSDPDGGALSVTAVKANNPRVKAKALTGGVVRVTPPKAAGTYGLVYTVSNKVGGSSSTFITVKVDPKSELNYPEAQDSTLTLRDVLGRKSVDVDVLNNVFFADGNVSALGIGLVAGYGDTASVTGNHRIRVAITDSSQIIPFFVSHPDDPSIRAYAFIRVPGFDDALPQINEAAPPLVVQSEKPLAIDLDDYVVSAGGNGVRLTDSSTVRATHSNGSDLVVDSTTLTFTSAPLFFGQASISFQVTDGTSASDPSGNKATLVLPIRVDAGENQPPVFNGTSLDLEPGSSRSIDLTRLTTYPYSNDLGELSYSITTSRPDGFHYSLAGRRLVVSADSGAKKGETGRIGLAVKDTAHAGQGGSIALTVVGSTRPLAIAASDSAVIRRGSTTTVDVLSNDEAANPFPGQALRVVAIRGLGGASLPTGVSVTPSGDRSRLTVRVAESAKAGNSELQYQLADVTNDPSRYVWGTVRISVQDVPDAPSAPTRSGAFVGGSLTLAYTAPVSHNSPITSYRLTGTSNSGNYTKDCGLSTICTLSDLDPGARYEFSVVAVSAIGASAPGPKSIPYSADFVPTAPTSVSVKPSGSTPNTLVVRWDAVPKPARGTSVTGYVVEVAGLGSQDATGTSATIAGLDSGSQYSVQVYARNDAQVSSTADWQRSGTVSGTAVGVPGAASITATVDDSGSGVVHLSHGTADPAGGRSVDYTYGRVEGSPSSSPSCSTGADKPNSLAPEQQDGNDSTAQDGTTYTYFVYADNGYFCTTSRAASVQNLKAPSGVTASATVTGDENPGYFDVKVSGLGVASGTAQSYFATDSSGNSRPVTNGTVLTGPGDASVYGHSNTWTIKACRTSDGDYCGADRKTLTETPVKVRATVDLCTPGEGLKVTQPTNDPAITPDGYTVEFSDGLGHWSDGDADGKYSSTSTVPPGSTEVRVQATVAGHTDPGYATATCQ